MNEKLVLRFTREGRPTPVKSLDRSLGLAFEEHPDASPLTIAVGLKPLFPTLLDPVRQRHDWREKELKLDADVRGGDVVFSGFDGDPEGLPAGVYDVSVEVESMSFSDSQQRVTVARNRSSPVVLDEVPDKRKVVLKLDGVDAEVDRILRDAGSAVDGKPALDWLQSKTPKPARKACLLNVLAKLRTPPRGLTRSLLTSYRSVFFADVDRIYAAAGPDLPGRLENPIEKQLWTRDTVIDSVHALLKERLTSKVGIPADDAKRFELSSYRQGGGSSLQIVVASPPDDFTDKTVYTDNDIDLGNPSWDLAGFFTHIGELIDSGKTDHLKLYGKLNKSDCKEFLYYEVKGA